MRTTIVARVAFVLLAFISGPLVAGENREPKFTRWETKFDGDAKQSQLVYLHNGGLYAIGGNRSRDTHTTDTNAFSDQAFRFDIANRSVEKLSNMPRALRSGTLAASGSRTAPVLHVMGGLAITDGMYASTNTIYSYDPRSNAWAKDIVLMPTHRSMFRVGRHDGMIWIFGGSEVIDGNRGLGTVLWRWSGDLHDAVEVVEGKPLPRGRRSGGGAQIGNRYYLVGGLGADQQAVAQTDVFDMAIQMWSVAASPQIPRILGSVAAIDGKLYLSGGLAEFSDDPEAVPSLEVYDPATDEWTTLIENQPSDCANMQIFEYQGQLLYYGIHPEKDGVATFALLDPTQLSEETSAFAKESQFNEVVRVGERAPDFSNLPGIDGKQHGLSEYKQAKAVVVVFTSNQCPVAVAYDDRLAALQREYDDRGVQLVAICANFEAGHDLDTLKEHAASKKFNFPVLRDDDQNVGRAYGASHTPHVFLLTSDRNIAYMGAIDDQEDSKKVSKYYLRDAIESVLSGREPATKETQQFGCRIRYKRHPADRTKP